MSKKSLKSKTKYTTRSPDGTIFIDPEGFKRLKKEQTIFCYNLEEPNPNLLEFFCSICNRGLKGIKQCESHWTNSKHKKQLHGYESKIKHSQNVRQLTHADEMELSRVLWRTTSENVISEDDYVERMNVCKDFEEAIKASGVYDISCTLLGSSETRIGLCNANVNIDIQYDLEKISKVQSHITNVPQFLFHIHATIQKSGKFCDVIDLFHTSIPKFTFTHVESGLHCIVCPHHKPGVRTALLLKDYLTIDERVKVLCIAFKNWAKICGLDDINAGSLSPYCFVIMVIHYLQQVDPPVLPIINLQKPLFIPPGLVIRTDESINPDQIESWKSRNTCSIAKLWVGLFKYYLLDFWFKTLVINITQHSPMTKHLRGLNSRRISIEDPFFIKDNVANDLTSSEVMDYFYSCLEKSYLYFSLCPTTEKGEKKIEVSPDAGKKSERKKRRSEEKADVAKDSNVKKNNLIEIPREDKDEELDSNGTKHVESLIESVISDIIGDTETDKIESHDSDSECSADSDSDDESEEEQERSEDEDLNYINRAEHDLMNFNDDSDVEIEEEYYESEAKHVNKQVPNEADDPEEIHKEAEVIGKEGRESGDVLDDAKSTAEKDEVPTNIELATSQTSSAGGEPISTRVKEPSSKSDIRDSSNEESDCNRLSSKDDDSQYEADVDSQTDDQAEVFTIEIETQSECESNNKDSGDNENLNQDSGDNEKLLPENKDSGDNENILPDNKDSGDNENILSDSKDSGDNEKLLSDCKDSGDNENILPDSKDSGDNENLLPENKDSGDNEKLLPDSKDSGDNEKLLPENKDSGDNEKLLPDCKDSGDNEKLLPGNKDSGDNENLIKSSGDNETLLSVIANLSISEPSDGPAKTGERTTETSIVEKNTVSHNEEDVDKQTVEWKASDAPRVTNDNDDAEEKMTKPRDQTTKLYGCKEMPNSPKFLFQRKFLAPLRTVPLYCRLCSKDGHRKTECDTLDSNKPPAVQPVTKPFLDMLDRLCITIFRTNQLTDLEKEQRTRILKEMERHLKKHFNQSCRLALFGSSVNLFGFRGSDLDICLRFGTADPPPGLDHAAMVVKVAKALDKHEDFQKVMYIKSAKVPIVKFVIRNLNLEGDISLYNCLALNNSRMLKAYASIDERVRILGYCTKVFAKVCEIGDASRGSLSSYAHTLLILYFLQRCEPPVIPVLQELYNGEKPASLVEGWNTWYFGDIDNLPKVWSGFGKNRQSVGELWLGFLCFYVEKFDFKRNVVATKQTRALSKFEKGWTHATMCIEDPFNLQHNLAGGITRNMFRYVLSCFRNARVHFHTAHPSFRKNSATEFLMTYFFNRNHLTENKHVPRDRLCHRCGRIGHTAQNCAEKIVADRERRRLDSERTYSSDNGDSDINQSKAKNSMDNVQCYGCRGFGHRAANCPKKGKSPMKDRRNGMNRDRRDSDRRDSERRDSERRDSERRDSERRDSERRDSERRDSERRNSERRDSDRKGAPSQQDNSHVIQSASDFHPKENIDVVLGKSEMVTKIQLDNNKHGSKADKTKALRMKAGDIGGTTKAGDVCRTTEAAGGDFSFSSPPQRKTLDPSEKADGHIFSPKTLSELNGLQASVDGVSFLLNTPPESPTDKSSQRRRISPLKPNRKSPKHKKTNSEQEIPAMTNKSDYLSLSGISPGKSPGNKKNDFSKGWQAPPGYEPISAEVQGTSPWLPNPQEYKFIGQAAAVNRMQSPNLNTTTVKPLMECIPTLHSQVARANGTAVSPVQQHNKGYHFAQPDISRFVKHRSDAPNHVTSPSKFNSHSPSKGSLSTPPGFPPNVHWPQAPVPPEGYKPVHESPKQRPNSLQGNSQNQSFQFQDFAKHFELANSPPKASQGFLSGSSPVKGANTMRYDEEYPSAPKSPKKSHKKSKRGKNNHS